MYRLLEKLARPDSSEAHSSQVLLSNTSFREIVSYPCRHICPLTRFPVPIYLAGTRRPLVLCDIKCSANTHFACCKLQPCWKLCSTVSARNDKGSALLRTGAVCRSCLNISLKCLQTDKGCAVPKKHVSQRLTRPLRNGFQAHGYRQTAEIVSHPSNIKLAKCCVKVACRFL